MIQTYSVGEVGGAGLQANQDRAYQDINNELTDLSAQIDLLVQANSKYVDYCDYLVINIPVRLHFSPFFFFAG